MRAKDSDTYSSINDSKSALYSENKKKTTPIYD